MTFGDFIDQDMDCYKCPVKNAGYCCAVAGKCYSPPCSIEDPDKDMDDYIKERKAREQATRRQEAEKKAKAQRRSQLTKEMKSYCATEYQLMKSLTKDVKQYEKTLNNLQMSANAYNFANKLFGYPEVKEINPKLFETRDWLKGMLEKAKEAYELKKKEFYDKKKRGEL